MCSRSLPDIARILNPLAPKLTTEASIQLQDEVGKLKSGGTSVTEAVKQVAREFLAESGPAPLQLKDQPSQIRRIAGRPARGGAAHGCCRASPLCRSTGDFYLSTAQGIRLAPLQRRSYSSGMQIAIIGTGNVGGALARAWARAGHRIFLGVRNLQDQKVLALTAGERRSPLTRPLKR